MTEKRTKDTFNVSALLHPAQAYEHPSKVLADPDLTLNEKRAILASWASDACAVEASPELREPVPGRIVRYDEIMDALRQLDQEARRHKIDYGKLISRAARVKELCFKDRAIRVERRP